MYQYTSIGVIPCGTNPGDGSDEYVLISRRDESDYSNLNIDEVADWFQEECYCPCFTPGGYFCHGTAVTLHPVMEDHAIGIIYHRYDV